MGMCHDEVCIRLAARISICTSIVHMACVHFPNLGVRVNADPVCDAGYAVLTPRGVQVAQPGKPPLRG